jgi:type IV pilus assembly protein PilB
MLAVEQAQHLAEASVRVEVAPWSAVMRCLDRAFGARDVIREMVGDVHEPADSHTKEDGQVLDLQQQAPTGKDGWIIKLANSILEGAIRQRASDIHLEPFENDAKIRYRIDGVLREIAPPSKSSFVPLVSRFKILARMDIAERRVPQDGAIALRLGELRVDVRVSTVPTVYGEKMVMRLLNKEGVPLDLRKLGFNDEQVKAFEEAIHRPHGLLFVTGPTGSGKSTTLYAALHQLNRPGCNIMTAEDPVEYKMRGLNQVHVRSNVGMTFASALRAFLRQDPDVIMVGEVRDRETAEICLRAALTGHFVLSTLHTNDSLSAVARLNDMGVEPFLLAATLRLVEAQRLVRRLCTECKEAYELDAETARRFTLEAGITLYRPTGCKNCHGSGYRGRVGIYEVIPITAELRDLIQTKASIVELQRAAKAGGFRFLRDAGLTKVREGVTSLEEVLTIAMGED